MTDRWRIITGEALEIMREMEPESVDAIVTDPPYASTNDASSAVSSNVHAPIPRETQFFEAWLREMLPDAEPERIAGPLFAEGEP